MQSQFLAAINQLCDEKNISKDTVVEAIKAALRAAFRKDYGNKDQNIDIDLKEDSENITVYLVKTVVKKVEDEDLEISDKEALKYKKKAKVGDEVKIDVTPVGYGRIAAQAAKQVIIQRLQEAERDVMYDMFKDRENELINALVHRVDNNQVYINLEKITAVLTPDQQIPNENYYGGQRLKVYLDKVEKTSKGPQLLISRTHRNLVAKLLELEIPEIKSGLVIVKGIAREPGIRSKIAVYSEDDKIDPIGSCVGQKGVRIQSVMDELNGERIDVIPWDENLEKFIKSALAPAKVTRIDISKKDKRAKVYVTTDQRPLAIGKKGQNVRLASRLTEYEIDILDISELDTGEEKKAEKKVDTTTEVSEIKGISKDIIGKLSSYNLTQVKQLKGLKVKDLEDIGLTAEEAQTVVDALTK
ncbi:transcription termination factor NusA [Patescibacteria group bacterium]|nr:transcription termination factor NusA [Patescibacteria group bacterium]